jgi:hypothetical protein
VNEREPQAFKRQQAIFDAADRLDEVENAVGDVAMLFHDLAVEPLPPDEIASLREEAGDLAYALDDALPILDDLELSTEEIDAPEQSIDVLRDLMDRRLSSRELSRRRQDGRKLARTLLTIADDIDDERSTLLDSLDDEDDDEEEE